MIQFTIVEDSLDRNVDFTCTKPSPILNADVTPVIHDATTEDYVNLTTLNFSYNITSSYSNNFTFSTQVICQEKINVTTPQQEIWMPFGFDNFPHTVLFSQVSLIFSVV